jgi:hypothetical protein
MYSRSPMPEEMRDIPLWPDDPSAADLLGFADIAAPVIAAIDRERLDPVAIGIFGDWGSGKSTILEIIGAQLLTRDDTIVVPTRPWEYDPSLDPRATLIAEVLAAVQQRAKADDTTWNRLQDQFKRLTKRIQWSKAFTVATTSAMTFTIPSIQNLTEIFSGGEESEDMTLQGFRDEFQKLMGEMSDVKRVVVLVDDLDRCLSPTVVMTLEAIKLFLSVPKMAFVLAADSRLVELSIAERFSQTPQGKRLAREYLEKIVQIPVSVPSLGLGDTEAYLSLMLVSHHVDQNAMTQLADHCDGRRRSAETHPFHDLPDGLVPLQAQSDLALAGMLAPVLYERLNGNPRRLKRFLNAFWVRLDIARRRGAAPEETVLAKLMMLELLDPDAFAQLLDWLTDRTITAKLAAIENGDMPPGANSAFERWAQVGPKLADENLAPYLSLAASLRSRPGPASGLRPELAAIAARLESEATTERSEARKQFSGLQVTDRIEIVREIMNIIRVEPRRYDGLGEAIDTFFQDGELTGEVIDGLRQLHPSRVDAGLIVNMGGDHPAAEAARTLLREWKESGQLAAVQENAADQVLQGG